MPNVLLPLFPLQIVMLPGLPVPLHIFEDRYKEMIGEAIKNSTEFGIVQAGERGVLNIGCSATVEKVVEQYEDGRLDIIVRGRRRFEIVLLNEEKPYLRGSVEFFDDEDTSPVPNELRALAIAGLTALRAADNSEEVVLPDARDPQLSFRIAWYITDLSFRQTLLGLRSETDRLRHLNAFLPEYVAKVRRTQHVKRVAPRNGHGMIRIGDGQAG